MLSPAPQRFHTPIPTYIRIYLFVIAVIIIWQINSLEAKAYSTSKASRSQQTANLVADSVDDIEIEANLPRHQAVVGITSSNYVTVTARSALATGVPDSNEGAVCQPLEQPEATSWRRSLVTGLLSRANQLTGKILPHTTLKKRVNILLLGSDRRPDEKFGRTDAIILVTIEPDRKAVGMLSIPRDLWVTIPGYGEKRINAAYRLGELHNHTGGGPALAIETIEANFGVPIDSYILVNFDGFTRIVDTLGGIDICVPKTIDAAAYYGYPAQSINKADYYSFVPVPVEQTGQTHQDDGQHEPVEVDLDANEQPRGYQFLYIEAGQHTLDGATALSYVRSRASVTADFARIQQQQAVLLAIRQKALQLGIIPKIPELWEAMGELVETDLELTDIMQLAALAQDISSDQIRAELIGHELTIDHTTNSGARVLLPKQPEINTLLAEMFGQGHPDAPLTGAETESGQAAGAAEKTIAWQP